MLLFALRESYFIPNKVKKEWSDMKLSTKKRVAAVKRAKQETGGGRCSATAA